MKRLVHLQIIPSLLLLLGILTTGFLMTGCPNPVSPKDPEDPLEAPAAPSGLSASTFSATQINLSWSDESDNETGFKIERSTTSSSGGFTQITTIGAGVTTYSDIGLSATTTYWYRVRASNSAGDSGYSNVAFATPPSGIIPPSAPDGLTAMAVSSSQINLNWADESDNEIGFKIERSITSSSGGFTQITTVGAGVTTYSDIGLSATTTYWYRVQAFNSAGDSGYSNVAFATPPSAQQTVTLNPQYDNLIMAQSNDSSVADTVYQNAGLAVGCNWIYSSLTGIQDYLAAASLVRFNVSSLSDKTIDSATLQLEVNFAGVGYYPRQWCVRAMATSWSTDSVTWKIIENSQYYTGSQINQNPPSYSGQIYNINVKSIVQNWANGTWTNYGLFFTSTNYTFPWATSYDAFEFYSLEDAGQGWPKLIVTYH